MKGRIAVVLSALSLWIFGLLTSNHEPLQGVHWDSPIYLYQAKRFAETSLLHSYVTSATNIAAQVEHPPRYESYSESYWWFARLGHIVVLGTVVSLLGSTAQTIISATWLYSIFLALGVVVAAFASMYGAELLGSHFSRKHLLIGALISAALYFISDSHGYLSASLVSENLAIPLLSVSFLCLLVALGRNSTLPALASGLTAFFTYTTRIESIWIFWALIIVLTIDSIRLRDYAKVKLLVVASLAAFLAYIIYLVAFWPLPDPRIYLKFGLGQAGFHHGVPAYMLLVVSIGGLFLGAAVAAIWTYHNRVVRIALSWTLLAILPCLPCFILALPVQTRMLSLVVIPAMFMSTLGWAWMVEQFAINKRVQLLAVTLAGTTAIAITLAWPESYAKLRALPGGWRLQYIKQWLVIPEYEQRYYPWENLANISQAVYKLSPAILVWNKKDLDLQELNIIRFFGSQYPEDSSLALHYDPTNPIPCGEKRMDIYLEPVTYCVGQLSEFDTGAWNDGVNVLYLTRTEEPSSAISLSNNEKIEGQSIVRAGLLELALVLPKAAGSRLGCNGLGCAGE